MMANDTFIYDTEHNTTDGSHIQWLSYMVWAMVTVTYVLIVDGFGHSTDIR